MNISPNPTKGKRNQSEHVEEENTKVKLMKAVNLIFTTENTMAIRILVIYVSGFPTAAYQQYVLCLDKLIISELDASYIIGMRTTEIITLELTN